MNNTLKVWITLNNCITMDGQTDSVGVEVEGELEQLSPLNVLRYKEQDVDGSVTDVVNRAFPNVMSVLRNGPVSSAMLLEPGTRNPCSFRMPEGMLTLDVELLEYTHSLQGGIYRWELHYLMYYGPTDPAEHRMVITARPM